MEILKYVFPVNYYQVQLENSEDGEVNQYFEIEPGSIPSLKMTDVDTMFGNTTTVKYEFEVRDSELVVLSCVEYSQDENDKKYSDGYPYVIIPRNFFSTAKWGYMYSIDRKICCESKLTKRRIDGEFRNVIVVKRDIQYLDLDGKGGIIWKEYYVEGKGLVKRDETLY